MYNKEVGDKSKLKKIWNKYSSEVQNQILLHVEKYVQFQPDKQFRKNISRYFKEKSWNDEIIRGNNNANIKSPHVAAEQGKVFNVTE
jgi:hypothetical protein